MRSSICSLLLFATAALAQQQPPAPTPGRIRGRVVEDGTGTPIIGAEVLLPKLQRSVRTDSAGRYEFTGLSPDTTLISVRALGFRPESTTVAVQNRRIVSLELRMGLEEAAAQRVRENAQPLPEAKTTVPTDELPGHLAEFAERRKLGAGRFIDREMLEKYANRRTGDILATVPSIQVKAGGMKAWVSSGRASDATCGLCRASAATSAGMLSILNASDVSSGARPACYMDVWVDGNRMYEFGHVPPMILFDINSFSPSSIEAMEIYVGAAQVPAKYAMRMNNVECGVILIWTRITEGKKP